MRIVTVHKENKEGIYSLPSSSYDLAIRINEEYLMPDEYEFVENGVKILNKTHKGDLRFSYINDKPKIIGFTQDHIFKYCDGEPVLLNNSNYMFSVRFNKLEEVTVDYESIVSEDGICSTDDESVVYINSYETREIKFDTKFNPAYCKNRDVIKLIGKVIKDSVEIDIERYIFDSSVDIKEEYEEILEEKGELWLKKLCSNTVALDIVYQFYYKLVDEVGSVEDSVGTLKTKRSRLSVSLDGLIKRFKDAIEDIKKGEDSGTKGTVKSFTKANSSTHPAGSRLW